MFLPPFLLSIFLLTALRKEEKGEGKQLFPPGSCIFTHQKAIFRDYRVCYSGLQSEVY